MTDTGSLWSISFHDPDGGRHEVIWAKPGVPGGEGLTPPPDWELIELD